MAISNPYYYQDGCLLLRLPNLPTSQPLVCRGARLSARKSPEIILFSTQLLPIGLDSRRINWKELLEQALAVYQPQISRVHLKLRVLSQPDKGQISLIAPCDMAYLEYFFAKLSQLLGMTIQPPPAYIAVYSNLSQGPGPLSQADFDACPPCDISYALLRQRNARIRIALKLG